MVVKVGWSLLDRILVWGGFPLLGAGLGWSLPWLLDRLRDLPFGPLGWLADLLDRAPGDLVTPVSLAAGALVGAVLAGIGEYEALRVEVGPDEMTLRRKDITTRVSRQDVSHVFAIGKRLVVLGTDGREQAAETFDIGTPRLAAAFDELGYPWRPGGDPYAADFRRWVPGMPGLPDGAGPLMVARQRALKRKDGDEAEMLRAELNAVGVLLKDVKGHQYWRPART